MAPKQPSQPGPPMTLSNMSLLAVVIGLGVTALAPNAASAIEHNPPSGRPPSSYGHFTPDFHLVAVHGDEDRRKTVEEFAAQVGENVTLIKNRYAPTGTLVCGGAREGSAQLTCDTDEITTAAHLFADKKTGKGIVDVAQCFFTIRTDAQTKTVQVDHLVDTGFNYQVNDNSDWAVMKLKGHITLKGVKPYRTDPNALNVLKVGDQVLNVGHSQDFIRYDRRGRPFSPEKHIGFCTILQVTTVGFDQIRIDADCDTGHRNSGGSLLNNNVNDPALLGVAVTNGETEEMLLKALREGTGPNTRPAEIGVWESRYVPIAGDFLAAIKKECKNDPVRR
jgi:hypothetical protein